MTFRPRHLLGIDPLARDELQSLLDRADSLASGGRPEDLSGRIVGLWIAEPSTRTRVSFELAAHRVGATAISLEATTSSMVKGESLIDTAETLEAAGVDVFVLRHHDAGAPHLVSSRVRGAVINAGDGMHEHPTQALLDLLTLRRHFGRIEGLHVGIVGDILHSRVARSVTLALAKLGARVTLAGPPALVPGSARALGAAISHDLDEFLPEVDALMALRIQHERSEAGFVSSLGAFAAAWGITDARVERMKPEAVVLHPGPFHRDVEISGSVADGPRSLILEQVRNGVFARMAAFEYACGVAR